MTNNIQEKNESSRRNFALGAGLAGLVLAAQRGEAQTTPAPTAPASDLAILNYALTLEHLEANFYTTGLTRLSQADFGNSTLAQVLGSGTIAGVYTNLGRIRDHEVAHVEALTTTIRTLGGTPVGPCTSYNFNYRTPDEFLRIAEMLEEVGVSAYLGAIAMIVTAALKTAGATIHSVEARHASYLKLLNSNVPFPKAFDEGKTMAEVLAMAAPFLGSNCPTSGGGGTTPPPGTRTTTAILLPKNLQTVGLQVALDASTSTSATDQPLTYSLRVVSGSAAILRGDTANPIVQFGGGRGDYVFELTVTDSAGTTATDRTTIQYVGI